MIRFQSRSVLRLAAMSAVLLGATATVSAAPYESLVRLPLPGDSFLSGANKTANETDVVLVSCNCPTCPCPSDGAYPTQPGAATPSDGGMGGANLGSEQFAGLGGDTIAVNDLVGGYIDPAVIQSRVRLRYDVANGNNFPDRAEYFYASPARGPSGVGLNNISFQELHTYIEWAWSPKFSIFGDFAARYVDGLNNTTNPNVFNPTQGTSHNAGAGDMNAGFRWGIIADPEGAYGQNLGNYLTLQVRTYIPTGDPRQGLGTGHTSVETGLLGQRQVSDNLILFGEILDWQASNASLIGGTDPRFGGNVLQWGIGASYALYNDFLYGRARRFSFVYEIVGWDVLQGFKSDANNGGAIENARGDAIINGKYGFRWTSGLNTLYIGYGQNYTDERWYSNLYRLEFAHAF